MKIPFKKLIKAVSILKGAGLKAWIEREWSSGYFSKGLEAFQEIAEKFLFPKVKNCHQNQSNNKMYQLQLP